MSSQQSGLLRSVRIYAVALFEETVYLSVFTDKVAVYEFHDSE
jgi:hypothetical protein